MTRRSWSVLVNVSDSPQLRMILALRRLGSALSMSNRAVGSALGIKDADLAVLDVLHREGPLTPTELARRTRTHLATMTGVLRRLEVGGWVERRPDATDRRSVRIHAAGVDRRHMDRGHVADRPDDTDRHMGRGERRFVPAQADQRTHGTYLAGLDRRLVVGGDARRARGSWC